MRKLLLLSLAFFSLLYFLILLFNTFTLFSRQTGVPRKEFVLEKENEIMDRISMSIQIPVISEERDSSSGKGIYHFTSFLNTGYKELHGSVDLKIKELNKNLFLYRLKGRNEKLKPLLFVFKIDVNDPDLKNLTKWTYQPFSGKIDKGFIWGAGSMGDKTNCTALFEALEALLKNNHQTQRSIYIAILKEEPNSLKNNELLADLLEQETKFEMILGCKSFVSTENSLNVNKKIAFINCAEPNTYELEINNENFQNLNIEDYSFINHKNEAVRDFLETLAPELNFINKFQICNYSLFGNFISSKLKKDKVIFESLFEKLVLNKLTKDQKTLEISYFASPNEPFEKIKPKIYQYFDSDEIKVRNTQYGYYTKSKNFSYEMLQSAVRQSLGDVIVLPGIGKNTSHMSIYKNLNTAIYNFSPMQLDLNEKNRLERGIDERISVENYKAMIKFYLCFLSNMLF